MAAAVALVALCLVAGSAFAQESDPEPDPKPVQEPAQATVKEPAEQPAAPSPPAADFPLYPGGAPAPLAVEPITLGDTLEDTDGDESGTPGDDPAEEGPRAESAESRAEGNFLPRLDVFFPEGELDLRVSGIVEKVFFEGQVQYNFIDGDITAYLRYRYYGFQRIYQVTAFDEVEFDSIEELSDDFERTRGFLFLTEWPHDFHRRTFALFEIDRIISNPEGLRFNNNTTNTYLRFGYQIGTPDDERSNAVVAERRAERRTLFTPFRQVGPGGAGATAAVTWGFDALLGDYDYVKFEAEALKRFEMPAGTFLFGRLSAGTFIHKILLPDTEDRFQADRYSIPRAELFRLDGSDNLVGLTERIRGTEQLYTTWEYFVPWFLNQERRALWLDWQNWYWVFYGGYGTAGFDRDVYSDFGTYYPDVGIGFESSFQLKKYAFFLSGIVAQALRGDGGIEAKLSIKSYR